MISNYELVGVNSHSMSWPAGTGPGLYKQIVVTHGYSTFNTLEGMARIVFIFINHYSKQKPGVFRVFTQAVLALD